MFYYIYYFYKYYYYFYYIGIFYYSFRTSYDVYYSLKYIFSYFNYFNYFNYFIKNKEIDISMYEIENVDNEWNLIEIYK